MNDIDIDLLAAFKQDYRDAKMYHRRAVQFLEEGQHFSVVFNVASVALERYLLALCELYGEEPVNHNYICLMDTVEIVIDVPDLLSKEIRSLDEDIFGICSLENYYHGDPEQSDTDKVLRLCEEVQQLFDQDKVAAACTVLENYTGE